MTLRDLIIQSTGELISHPDSLTDLEVIGYEKTSPISLIMYLVSDKFQDDLDLMKRELKKNNNRKNTKIIISRNPESIDYTLALKEVSE